ncbi:hypothetical protein GQ42DRAFT_181899 [Ramicandelaber brevisporus]|nr:hypothetical protein GQ42DRAFT_181899 [Ramicandelaber brevisporus]
MAGGRLARPTVCQRCRSIRTASNTVSCGHCCRIKLWTASATSAGEKPTAPSCSGNRSTRRHALTSSRSGATGDRVAVVEAGAEDRAEDSAEAGAEADVEAGVLDSVASIGEALTTCRHDAADPTSTAAAMSMNARLRTPTSIESSRIGRTPSACLPASLCLVCSYASMSLAVRTGFVPPGWPLPCLPAVAVAVSVAALASVSSASAVSAGPASVASASVSASVGHVSSAPVAYAGPAAVSSAPVAASALSAAAAAAAVSSAPVASAAGPAACPAAAVLSAAAAALSAVRLPCALRGSPLHSRAA